MLIGVAFLAGLTEWASGVVKSLGYPGVALLIALENVFPPIPSELVLPLTGFLVGRGEFSLMPALIAATVGSLVGALAIYGVGYVVGEDRVRAFIGKYGRYLLVGEDDLDRAHDWFERHGWLAVLLCRMVPGLRSVISLPAGVERMSIVPFVLLTTLGSAIWNGVLIGAGWWLGDQWDLVSDYLEIVQYVIIGIAVVAIGWFIVSRTREHA
jgi:membrane protein DedA with SNARE-associated domain